MKWLYIQKWIYNWVVIKGILPQSNNYEDAVLYKNKQEE